MNKKFIFTLFFSYIFSQSSIDTLSVTIYPEYYYQGIMVEYRFDKNPNEKHTFNLSTEVDSVLYLVSKGDEFFEEVIKIDNQSDKVEVIKSDMSGMKADIESVKTDIKIFKEENKNPLAG